MTYDPNQHYHHVGNDSVSILTDHAAGMLPVVVQNLTTGEVLFFTATGDVEPGSDRPKLVSGKRKDRRTSNAYGLGRRTMADILRILCDSLSTCVPGSPEAILVAKLMQDVNRVVCEFDERRRTATQTSEEAAEPVREEFRPVPPEGYRGPVRRPGDPLDF